MQIRLDDLCLHFGFLQEKKMEMSHNQCQDLKARYEEASSETEAKHKEVLQNLQKTLSGTEERLKAAQKENSDLLQEMVDLKKQADKAKVCYGENGDIALVCCSSASGWRGLGEEQQHMA